MLSNKSKVACNIGTPKPGSIGTPARAIYGKTKRGEYMSEKQAVRKEVLQLCRQPVIGWPDARPGLFGLRFIQVAPI
jgi:hypothetical protein